MAPKSNRSRSGCLTCRQRKLKCTEERPTCAQCVKANRECMPSSGITFRHQQNPSMNGQIGDDSLKSFYGYKETFAESTQWVSVPRDLTFVHTTNPYEDEEGEQLGAPLVGPDPRWLAGLAHASCDDPKVQGDFGSAYATHGLEALSAVASQDQYSFALPPAPMNHHEQTASLLSQHAHPALSVSPQHSHATPSQNLDFILNPTSVMSTTESNLDPQLHLQTPDAPSVNTPHSPSHVRTTSLSTSGRTSLRCKDRRAAIEDPELAFLLRDYTERPGTWMDLFDLDLFFAAKVPVLAVTCPLLLYSCASLSAKSLARVHGRKPVMGGQVSTSRQSKMEFWPSPSLDQEGWVRKGREYYDIAVSLLRQSLAGASRPPTSSLPEDATPGTIHTAQGSPLPTTDSDELVAATAILCVYEFLDASGPEWSRHLDGAKTLFDITKDQVLTLPPSPVSIAQQVTQQLASQYGSVQPMPTTRRGLSQGRRAVFWNFARQDMLSAFINNTGTRLDTNDLPMWTSAGLKLTPEGFVSTSNRADTEFTPDQAMNDDMVGNALVWLVMKLVNFIAAGDDVPDNISPRGLGVRQRELLDYWESLNEQLCVWHDGLPDIFHPTAIRGNSVEECGTEMWFPRSMCASTMQWFHFARIQLLHNKPHLSTATPVHGILGVGAPGTSLATRYASYVSILQQSRSHAKEIAAVSLGRADEGTRIHAVQPLWTAGLVLGNDDRPGENGEVSADTDEWRRTIVGLLRGIERDMGWASEYRVQSLLELWGGLAPDWPGESPVE
ncbi:hypothetical protein DOTSEDRAFT_68677 [Dothistroma septosporum NZE10]|uniref:Zn(2)-C6 fungal-type domain-containing protein n=1 Tax=Dothistroma septosporum (strain NZE10 / CBS 128990) TaxID=675120 RepID=N1Q3X2_DOTSN|nr:hypothetical protein DOTSEDRAFT_68677 [Dothistroma septosporum NZE10]